MHLIRICLFLCLCASLHAQEMRVERVKVVDQSTPIFNIHVDENNKKWVSNTKGEVYLLHALDLADNIDKASNKQYLYDLPGGNADISWPRSAMESALGSGVEILSAFYDQQKKDLWIGTIDDGAFRLKVEPSLRVAERINTGNSKLKSNRINVVYKDYKKRIWLGTEEGAYIGADDKWKLVEKYYNIEAITGYGNNTWAMGDESVWEIDKRDDWLLLDIDVRRDIEGPMRDIALDHDGNLWIASNVMTRYNIETEKYTVFGPGQYITSQYVNCIAVDGDGTLWIGSEDKGMYHIERADNIVVTALVEKGLSCDGLTDDASLIVKVTGGEAPFTYAWDQGIEGDNPKNLAGGTYRITVTDSDGKFNSTSVEIPDPKMKLNVEVESEETGIGNKDGVASVTIEGGLPEYTIKWDNGEYGKKAKKLTGGTHSLIVIDKTGCEAKAAFSVGQKTEEIDIAITMEDKLKCFGEANASVIAKVTGGRPPYKYIWEGSDEATEKRTYLSAGSYQLTVRDADGKEGLGTINIIEPQKMIVNVKTIQQATANNEDGKAMAEVEGGRAPLIYQWDNGEKNAQANKLAPGEHTVIVTDASGCTMEATVNVSENIEVLSLEVVQTQEIKCFGEKTAAFKVEISGGKAPFSYAWSDPSFEGDQISKVGSGRYALTVKDATGTEASYSLSVEEPSEITAEIKSISAASDGAENGVAEVKVKGAKGRLIYRWDNGEGTAKATKLGPGAHSVSISTEGGCVIEASTEVEANYGEVTAKIKKVSEISCPGEKDGHIQIEVDGGKGPYEYKWSDASIVGGNPSNIGAGKYEVTIVDDLGSSTIAKLNFEDPEALKGNITVVNPATTGNEDAKAEVKVSGGSGKYYYKWDNGENTAIASKLAPGTRTLLVSDENECTLNLTVEIKEDILDLAASFEQTETINCNGDNAAAAILNVSGGKGPYTLTWSDNVEGNPSLNNGKVNLSSLSAGNYSVEIKDAVAGTKSVNLNIEEPKELIASATVIKAANTNAEDGVAEVKVDGGNGKYTYKWDNGETKAKATSLSAGVHKVSITDEANCTTEASVEITEDILALAVSIDQTAEITCAGESTAAFVVEVNGGKPPYTYEWSDAAISGDKVQQVGAGSYSVEVKDASGKVKSASIDIEDPEALSATAKVTAMATVGKENGTAEVAASGGTGKYSYAWDNGAKGAKVEKLSPGEHTVTVTDGSGCSTTSTIEVFENVLELGATIAQVDNIQCNGENQASLKVELQGGKGPFTYKWNVTALSGEAPTNVGAGSYSVEVTDAKGNTTNANIDIEEPSKLSATIKVDAPAATGQENGKATVSAEGGKGRYSYEWDNGEKTATASKLGPGKHSVKVTDENNCSVSEEIEISENVLALQINLKQKGEIKCNGATDGELIVDVNGGKEPYTFKWNDASANGGNPNALKAGSYAVTVSDATGKSQSASIDITEPAAFSIELQEIRPSKEGTKGDGRAKIFLIGGEPSFKYAWDNGETTKSAKTLTIGQHSVTVTDAKGCQVVENFEIKKKILPNLTMAKLESGQPVKMEQLQFEADSTEILDVSIPTLNEVYNFLEDNTEIIVEIGGHTNGLPEHDFCDRLSTARAKEVASYIVQKGIPEDRVYYRGYGKRKPIASNYTKEGRARNQRVEIKIIKLKK